MVCDLRQHFFVLVFSVGLTVGCLSLPSQATQFSITQLHEKLDGLVQKLGGGPVSSISLHGCAHVYLDLGSNVGVHVRKLFEPEKYPNSLMLPIFQQYVGSAEERRKSVCAVSIEANPHHVPRLKEVSEAYKAMGWRHYVVAPAAVSGSNFDLLRLFIETDSSNNQWGTSVFDPNVRGIPAVATDVPTIDIGLFVEEVICHRTLPGNGTSSQPPTVLLKVDIEGAEFIAYASLLTHSAFCCITALTQELHWSIFPLHVYPHFLSLYSSIVGLAQARFGCDSYPSAPPTRFLDIDDESYIMDGLPFPTPHH